MEWGAQLQEETRRVLDPAAPPLDLAAWAGHGQVVERLIEAGADFMQEDDNGNTAVHWARGDAEVVLKRHTLKAIAGEPSDRSSTRIKDL